MRVSSTFVNYNCLQGTLTYIVNDNSIIQCDVNRYGTPVVVNNELSEISR